MFKHTLALVGFSLSVITLSVITLSANAALYYRGNGMIYDDTRNITWLQDANYAKTSGYDADGKMSWSAARDWAANLIYKNYDDWRLPSVNDNPELGSDKSSGELGHMYYTNLGKNFFEPLSVNPSFTDANDSSTKHFSNVQADLYWYDEQHSELDTYSWIFYTNNGYQDYTPSINEGFSWAVRTGDVPQVVDAPQVVPVPETMWLFGAALLGLAGVVRRHR